MKQIKLLTLDLDAVQIASPTGLNLNAINRHLNAIRLRIAIFFEGQSPFTGEVEVDGSCFGARPAKRKRGRGASGRTIVFGILKRNGFVTT